MLKALWRRNRGLSIRYISHIKSLKIDTLRAFIKNAQFFNQNIKHLTIGFKIKTVLPFIIKCLQTSQVKKKYSFIKLNITIMRTSSMSQHLVSHSSSFYLPTIHFKTNKLEPRFVNGRKELMSDDSSYMPLSGQLARETETLRIRSYVRL